jgi:hypothetical protein
MITRIEQGAYRLVETRHGTKILLLGHKKFAWIMAHQIGSLLIWSNMFHRVRDTLASGMYYLYDVRGEPRVSDQPHLELQIGSDEWQGYLLPTGLPTTNDTRKLFIPTPEVITHNTAYRPIGKYTGHRRRVMLSAS